MKERKHINGLEMKRAIEDVIQRLNSTGTPEQPGLYAFPSVQNCGEDGREAYIHFYTYPWMTNRWQVVHGGVVASMMDNSMGLTTIGALGMHSGVTPTLSITIDYLHPTPIGQDIIVHSRITGLDEKAATVEAELYTCEQPSRILVRGKGTYYIKKVLQQISSESAGK